ncbi:hypothetical protein ACLOJK_030384 [Asimina triloba]
MEIMKMMRAALAIKSNFMVHIVYLEEKGHEDPTVISNSHLHMLCAVLGSYRHGFSGFAAKLTASQAQKLAEFPEAVHIVYLGEKRHEDPTVITDSHHHMLAAVLGSKEAAGEAMVYSYRHGFSGFAAKLTASQAQKLAEFPEVVHVIPNRFHKPHTTRSWDYLGLDSHSSSSNLASKSKMGDGVIVGVMDSGIGPIPSRWKGACETGHLFNATNCNRKLIGARWYIKGMMAELGGIVDLSDNNIFSPRDTHSHGTHTASTAAGNLVGDVSVRGLAMGTARGGAPKVRLAIYKVIWRIGRIQSGTSADILKAFDDAIHDGVDVLSLSLGPANEIYLDTDPRNIIGIGIGAFHAVAKGITVVCAAGNDGPEAQTVTDASPWIITVAASTLDRSFPTLITLGDNRTIVGQGMFTGRKQVGFTGFVSPSSQFESIDPIASMCSSLNPENHTLTGKVVLCFDKLVNQHADDAVEVVKAAGGVGLIFARNPGQPIASCENLPCVEVDFEIGKQLHFYIRSSRLALEASFTLRKNHMQAFSWFCTYLFVDEQRLLAVELAQVSNGEDKPFSNKNRQALVS